MIWLWTWGGECFGYRDGDALWTHDGRNVGHFFDDEVYSNNGRYLGEIKSENRLITNLSKKHQSRGVYAPYGNRVGYVRYVNYVGYVMYAGYEDFPKPEDVV